MFFKKRFTGVICVGVKPRRLEQSTQAPLQSFLQKKLRAAGSLILTYTIRLIGAQSINLSCYSMSLIDVMKDKNDTNVQHIRLIVLSKICQSM